MSAMGDGALVVLALLAHPGELWEGVGLVGHDLPWQRCQRPALPQGVAPACPWLLGAMVVLVALAGLCC